MTTINVAIANNADDGNTYNGTNFDASAVRVLVGGVSSREYDTFLRFVGISGLAGAIANNGCKITVMPNSPGGIASVDTSIGMYNGGAAPAAPVSAAQHNTLQASSTLEVPWDALLVNNVSTDSPEIKTVVQDLIDTPLDPSVIIVLHDIDTLVDGNFMRYDALEEGLGGEVVLNIEYTAAVGGLSIPIAAHHYRQQQGVN